MSRDTHGLIRIGSNYLDLIGLRNLHRQLIECARINVPCVVVFRRVLEELQLVSAPSGSDVFEFRAEIDDARDAPSGFVDCNSAGPLSNDLCFADNPLFPAVKDKDVAFSLNAR